MKFKGWIGFILICFSGVAQQPEKISFSLLAQNDKVEALATKQEKSFYEDLKYLSLGDKAFLSFGGSYRFQAESFINEEFLRDGKQDNFWLLHRVLLHAHLKVNSAFEFFAEVGSSTAVGKDDVSPVDKDVLYINQLFFKYHITPNWYIKAGRENLIYGGRRLIDLREGPNVRRSFDQAGIYFENEKLKISTFFGVPVKPKNNSFDNDYLIFDETLTGLYLTRTWREGLNLDVYGFYQKDNQVTYNSATGNERRYSIGVRFFGETEKFRFNNEFVYQTGHFSEQRIGAWTLSLNGELKSHLGKSQLRWGLKTELISGDRDPDYNRQNTFDAMYPRGAYFGRVARFGPANLFDIHPYVNFNAGKFYFELDQDLFWRYSVHDAVYNAALMPEYSSTNSKSFIGNQIGNLMGYEADKHFNIEFESNIIFPGAFLKESGNTNTLYHFVVTAEYKF